MIAGVAYGIAEAVAAVTEVVVLVIVVIVAVVFAAVVAGAVWATVYRSRHHEFPWARLQRRVLGESVLCELPGPERPAINTPRPQVVNNFFGVSAAEVAELIRRGEWPE